MADVIEKDLTKVTSSDLAPITKPSSGTDKRYMRMVDKDGNSVDVEVSAFLRAAIRDELASILESGGTGGGSVLSVIGGVLKTRTDADLASVLGGRYGNNIQAYHMPNDKGTFFGGYNPFARTGMSGYGIILRFKQNSYSGWLGIETPDGSIDKSHLLMAITTYDNFPTTSDYWRILNV